jgi:hypothetical protein
MNLSTNTGVFPLALKRTVVIPIFKKNDKSSLDNYRPISLLSIFSKIFEKAMKSRMVHFLNKNHFLSPLQFEFRKNKNTEQAILTVLEQISGNIDLGLKSSGLFVDMTKAFDRVDHAILLKKLYCCGFRGLIYSWLCSYLSDRSQVVRVNRQLSGELTITAGVPQGSVLGPLLFLVYVNGILRRPFVGSLTAFADDFSFVYSGSSKQANISGIEHDLDLLAEWLKAHNLLLSEKTKIVHFRDSQQLSDALPFHDYGCNKALTCTSSGCFKISVVNEIRYLGILIDANLNWKAHIEGLKHKLLLVSKKMYVLRLFCPLYLRRLVYYALVDSILLYGLACWGSACKLLMKSFLVRQKHVNRLIRFS